MRMLKFSLGFLLAAGFGLATAASNPGDLIQDGATRHAGSSEQFEDNQVMAIPMPPLGGTGVVVRNEQYPAANVGEWVVTTHFHFRSGILVNVIVGSVFYDTMIQ